jgi:hypothetical protein
MTIEIVVKATQKIERKNVLQHVLGLNISVGTAIKLPQA